MKLTRPEPISGFLSLKVLHENSQNRAENIPNAAQLKLELISHSGNTTVNTPIDELIVKNCRINFNNPI